MALERPAEWGPLQSRYADKRPRRMLALDGGGMRGLITLQALRALEAKLRRHYATDDMRLCEFFDYVGGTSTGAIIAASIARGLSVDEIDDFYRAFGAVAFTRRHWGVWKSLYKNGPLEQKLKEVFGEEIDLRARHLKALLLVVVRNATTDSAWPVSSNPDAKYNDPDRDDCNLQIPLWQLVRASTAAPIYFPPEVIEWEPDNPDKAFVFVDGGTTSYNNPAFLMVRMATEPAYKLNWDRGERKLLVVSLGTGSSPELGADDEDPESNLASSAKNTLVSLMNQAAYDQDVNARTIGRCTHGDVIDREVGDLVPRRNGRAVPVSEDLGRAFLYVRYNAPLTREWLDSKDLGDVDPATVRRLDSVAAMPDLIRVGERLAQEVNLDHLGAFIDQPLTHQNRG